MRKSNDRQLELSLRIPTAAERKAMICDRLLGYELRQSAREARRRQKRAASQRRPGRGRGRPRKNAPGVPASAEQLLLPDLPPP